MSRNAIVPEEWVYAAMKAYVASPHYQDSPRVAMRSALEAVVPLAEQRATRNLMKAREETEGR